MTFKYGATPEVLGYKPGAILLALTAGTTDGLENVQSVQGQPYSLLRAWQAATLSYVTLGVDASGNLLTAGGGTGAGSTTVDATLKASTAVVGHVVVDSMPSVATSTTVDANLSSAGSTRLIGRVEVNTPTTSVTVTNPTTSVTITNPTTSVTVTNPSTAVDATLSSAGSTRLVGQMTVANPTTAVSVSSGVVLGAGSSGNTLGAVAVVNPTTSVTLTNPATAVTVSNPTTSVTITNPATAVTVSSGVVLGAGSTANSLGAVALLAGTTANSLGSVALVAGTSGNIVGSVALVAGSSANTIGNAAQGPGSTGNYWTFNSIPFSSGGIARTSVSTTVDVQIIAANASRKALVIANGSTTQVVAIGFTTGAVTTALGNVNVYLQPTSQLCLGLGGADLPLYTGPIRGINITSSVIAGGVFVTEYS